MQWAGILFCCAFFVASENAPENHVFTYPNSQFLNPKLAKHYASITKALDDFDIQQDLLNMKMREYSIEESKFENFVTALTKREEYAGDETELLKWLHADAGVQMVPKYNELTNVFTFTIRAFYHLGDELIKFMEGNIETKLTFKDYLRAQGIASKTVQSESREDDWQSRHSRHNPAANSSSPPDTCLWDHRAIYQPPDTCLWDHRATHQQIVDRSVQASHVEGRAAKNAHAKPAKPVFKYQDSQLLSPKLREAYALITKAFESYCPFRKVTKAFESSDIQQDNLNLKTRQYSIMDSNFKDFVTSLAQREEYEGDKMELLTWLHVKDTTRAHVQVVPNYNNLTNVFKFTVRALYRVGDGPEKEVKFMERAFDSNLKIKHQVVQQRGLRGCFANVGDQIMGAAWGSDFPQEARDEYEEKLHAVLAGGSILNAWIGETFKDFLEGQGITVETVHPGELAEDLKKLDVPQKEEV